MCKKFVLMILLLSCLAFASYQAKVGANTLNVRMSGSTSSKVIAKLKKGDEVTVYLCQNGFCEVSFENGSGFVSEKFISQIEESSSHENEITSEDIANIKMFLIILGILTILATMLVFGLSKYNAKLSLVAFLLMLAINIWGIVSYNILFIGLDIVAGIIGFFLGLALACQNEGRSSSEGGSFWDSSDDDRAKERREKQERKKTVQIVSAYMDRHGRASCSLMDGNGHRIFPDLSVQADEVLGFTSTTLSVRHRGEGLIYRLNPTKCGLELFSRDCSSKFKK
jgi:hypothetical protein